MFYRYVWQRELTCDLANAIVRRPGWKVLIFPTISLGHGGANGIGRRNVFPGTYTVRATTLRSVFMDLASELGEQGFRWIFYLNMHFPPNEHNLALHQACSYFNDVYGGKMVHLMGLIDFSILDGVLPAEDQKVAGMDIHAGALETGWMLAFHPDLVNPAYKQAATKSGRSWEELGRMASAPVISICLLASSIRWSFSTSDGRSSMPQDSPLFVMNSKLLFLS